MSMDKEELKRKLQAEPTPTTTAFEGDAAEDVSVISATLPRMKSPRHLHFRRAGFWPETIERCRHLSVNQAIKVRLLDNEIPRRFASTAKAVARDKGFYLNVVYKYPFMYLWPDRMRGRVLPDERNSKGAFVFDDEKEVGE